MKRRFELESRKLKFSTSQEKLLNQRSTGSSRMHLEKYSPLFWRSPQNRQIPNLNEASESFDTCIFPSTDITTSRFSKISKEVSSQTESSISGYDSLHIENKALSAEVQYLRRELEDLKLIVEDLVNCKSLVKIRTNEDLIKHLQKENSMIRQSLQGKKFMKTEEDSDNLSDC